MRVFALKAAALVFLSGALGGALWGAAAAEAPDPARAAAIFSEAEAACARDRGWLWNGPLCGPLLFVDPESRAVAANQTAPGLTRIGAVHVGLLPEGIDPRASTADWRGVRWALAPWPAPEAQDEALRRVLALHWRRAMEARGIAMRAPAAEHLDAEEARIATRLEWRALAAALMAPSRSAQRQAIADAVSFRAWRRSLSASATATENALELTDGLAAYTGAKLSGEAAPEARIAALLRAAEDAPAFAPLYAETMGPAYGLLLDRFDGAGWRRRLTPGADLGAVLAAAADVAPPGAEAAAPLGAAYGGAAIATEEHARVVARESVLAIWRRKLIEAPAMRLPLEAPEISADGANAVRLGEAGLVHPVARVIDRWGVLEARDGVLIADGEARIASPANAEAREGPGWRLELAPGWAIERGEKPGDYVMKFRGGGEEEAPAAAEGSEQAE